MWQKSFQQYSYYQSFSIVFSLMWPPIWMETMHWSCHFQCGNWSLVKRTCQPFPQGIHNCIHRSIRKTCSFWYLRICSRFPFDTKNPIGYVIAVIVQYICQKLLLMFGATLICFGIGIFLFTMALVNDVKSSLMNVQRSANTRNHRAALMHFSNFFQYYSDARRLNLIFWFVNKPTHRRVMICFVFAD